MYSKIAIAALLGALAPRLAVTKASDNNARVIAEFDLVDGDFILLPVSLGRDKFPFVLGTGQRMVRFDKHLRPLLGAPERIARLRADTADSENVELFAAPDASIGPFPMRSPLPHETPLVVCEDWSPERRRTGLDIRGYLGMDFLRRYVIRLDPDQGKVQFLTAAGLDAGVAVPMITKGRNWCIHGRISGLLETDFTVSTELAWQSGSVQVGYADELLRVGAATIVRDAGPQLGNPRTLRALAIEVGGFKPQAIILGEHLPPTPNTLGLAYLMRYIVTFDFPRGVVYLKPSRQFDRKDVNLESIPIRAGIGLQRSEGETLVLQVVPGSPADRAGLRRKDVLRSINGTDVSRASMFTVWKLLSNAGNTIEVSCDRGGEILSLTLRLPENGRSRGAPQQNQ